MGNEIYDMLKSVVWRDHGNYGASVALFSPGGKQLGDDLPIKRHNYRGEDWVVDIDDLDLAECQRRLDAAPDGTYLRCRTATSGVKNVWQKCCHVWERVLPNYPEFL